VIDEPDVNGGRAAKRAKPFRRAMVGQSECMISLRAIR
jgi:hypothetical protein